MSVSLLGEYIINNIMIILFETFDVIVLWASIDYLIMFTSKTFCAEKAPTNFCQRKHCVALLIDYHGMFMSKNIVRA